MEIDEEDLRVVKVFRALSNGVRYRIIRILTEKPCNVSKIAEELDCSQSRVSNHLRVLRDRNLVEFESEGNTVIYELKRPNIIDQLLAIRPMLRREKKENLSDLTGA